VAKPSSGPTNGQPARRRTARPSGIALGLWRRCAVFRLCECVWTSVAKDTDLEIGLEGREALSVGPQRGVQIRQAVSRQGHHHRVRLHTHHTYDESGMSKEGWPHAQEGFVPQQQTVPWGWVVNNHIPPLHVTRVLTEAIVNTVTRASP
jgi:hypothetical protein